jgi:glutathione S-transferase
MCVTGMVASSYELLATEGTAAYQISKVRLAARYASVVVEEKLSCSADELTRLLPSAKSLILRVTSGFGTELLLTRSNVVLRFLAELRADAGLYGQTAYQSALVDQWLDFSFNSIEVPAAVLVAMQNDAPVSRLKSICWK